MPRAIALHTQVTISGVGMQLIKLIKNCTSEHTSKVPILYNFPWHLQTLLPLGYILWNTMYQHPFVMVPLCLLLLCPHIVCPHILCWSWPKDGLNGRSVINIHFVHSGKWIYCPDIFMTLKLLCSSVYVYELSTFSLPIMYFPQIHTLIHQLSLTFLPWSHVIRDTQSWCLTFCLTFLFNLPKSYNWLSTILF